MARTPTAPAPESTAPEAPEAPASQPAETWSWQDLEATINMPNRPVDTDSRINVLTSTPAQIRRRAEDSLAANVLRVAAKSGSTAARARVDYRWDCQPIPTVELGQEFGKAMVRYAKYRPASGDIEFAALRSPKGQVTARAQAPSWYRLEEIDGDFVPVPARKDDAGAFLGVRYSVRPFEQRKDTARINR